MNLYLISQDANRGYDTYDSAVVAAKDEESAKMIVPGGGDWKDKFYTCSWTDSPDNVKVDLIGKAKPGTE